MTNDCPWSFFEAAQADSCEAVLCSWVVNPGNAWTSVAYLVAAILIFRKRDSTNLALNKLFFYASMLVCGASLLFHTSGAAWAKTLDLSTLFIFSMAFLVSSLQRLLRFERRLLSALFFAGVATSVALLLTLRTGKTIFGIQVISCAGIEIYLARNKGDSLDGKNLMAGILAFGAAFVFFVLDNEKILCDPANHVFSAHGAWHFLTAAAIYFMYLAYSSKTRIYPPSEIR